MKLTRPRRPAQSETVIALIDVVFFLLVFFMLIGRMDATAPFDVVPPIASSGQDLPAGGVTLSVAADGAVAWDGVPVARIDLPGRLDEMARARPEALLRVNAHRDAELRHVLPLVGMADRAGIAETVLVVTPALPNGVP